MCLGCDEQVYCGRCWMMEHKEEDMAAHLWKGADSGKSVAPPLPPPPASLSRSSSMLPESLPYLHTPRKRHIACLTFAMHVYSVQ